MSISKAGEQKQRPAGIASAPEIAQQSRLTASVPVVETASLQIQNAAIIRRPQGRVIR